MGDQTLAKPQVTQRLGIATFNFESLLTATAVDGLTKIANQIKGLPPTERDSTLVGLLKEQEILVRVVLNAFDSWGHNKIYGKQESIEDLFKLFTTPTGRTSVLFSENNGNIKVAGSSLFIIDPTFYPKDQIDWKLVKQKYPCISGEKIVRGCRIFHLSNSDDDKTIDPIISLLKQSFDDVARELNVPVENLRTITKLNSQNPLIINYLRSRGLIEDFQHPESDGYHIFLLHSPKNSLNSLKAVAIPKWMEQLRLVFNPGSSCLLIGAKDELASVAAAFASFSPDLQVGVSFSDERKISKKALAPNEQEYPPLNEITTTFSHIALVGKESEVSSKIGKLSSIINSGGNLTVVIEKDAELYLSQFHKHNLRLLSSSQHEDKSVYLFQKVDPGEPVRVENTINSQPKFLQVARYTSIDGEQREVALPQREKTLTVDILPIKYINGICHVASNLGVPRVPPILVPRLDPRHTVGVFTSQQVSAIQKVPKEFQIKLLLEQLRKNPESVVAEILKNKSGIESKFTVQGSFVHLPSIGNSSEVVICFLAELSDVDKQSKNLKWIPLEEHLRLSQHTPSGISDGRSELMIYDLILKGAEPGKWIGKKVNLEKRNINIDPEEIGAFRAVNAYKRFNLEAASSTEYLEVGSVTSTEYNSENAPVGEKIVDYIHSKNSVDYSSNLVSVIPVCRNKYGVYVGLEERHYPSLQLAGFGSGTYAVPIFRLNKEIIDLDKILPEISRRFNNEVLNDEERVIQFGKLGEFYYPSAGITPDSVYPYFVEVQPKSTDQLKWFKLKDLLDYHTEFPISGQTRMSIFRLAHATGLLNKK